MKELNLDGIDLKETKVKPQKIDNSPICGGPMYEDCEKCIILEDCLKNDLNWYLNIKHWVLDFALKELSGSAFKVFMFLSKTANRIPGSNHFARCWLSYDQIREATGIKRIDRCLQELDVIGLINHIQTQKKEHGTFNTINQFTVNWLKVRESILEAVKVRSKPN